MQAVHQQDGKLMKGEPTAGIYLRVSTKEQGSANHVSLEVQQAACEKYAADKGLRVVATYQDMESGTNPDRRGYQRLLSDAVAGRFNHVVIYESSRWGRNTGEAHRSIDALTAVGVEVVSTAHDLGDRVSTGVHILMNAEYSFKLSETVRPAMARVAEAGNWPSGQIPFGYRCERDPLPSGKLGPRRIVPDEQTAPLVRAAFELVANGGSLADCARFFEHKGTGPVTRTGAKALLTNPFYVGRVRWLDPARHLDKNQARAARNRGEREYKEYPGAHEAIIDPALWEAAQIAAGRRSEIRPRQFNEGIAAGLVRCGHCGSRMQWTQVLGRARKDGSARRQYQYYHCKAKATDQCREWYVRGDKLDPWFRDQLRQLTVDEDNVLRVTAILEARRAELTAAHEAERKRTEQALSTARTRLDRLTDALMDGTIDKPFFIKKRAEYEAQAREFESQLTAAHTPAEPFDLAGIVQAARRLSKTLSESDKVARRDVAKVVHKIELFSRTDWRIHYVTEGVLASL